MGLTISYPWLSWFRFMFLLALCRCHLPDDIHYIISVTRVVTSEITDAWCSKVKVTVFSEIPHIVDCADLPISDMLPLKQDIRENINLLKVWNHFMINKELLVLPTCYSNMTKYVFVRWCKNKMVTCQLASKLFKQTSSEFYRHSIYYSTKKLKNTPLLRKAGVP